MTTAALPLHPAPAVLADLLPAGTRARAIARDVALVAGLALLTALAAQVRVPVPGLPVPVTGQTFAVLLGAAALGPVRGALAQVLYIGVGVAGMPVFTGGASGWEVIVGASGGYIVGFVLASLAVGALARRGADRRVLGAAGAYAVGTLTVYAVGVPWLAVVAGMDPAQALWGGLAVFLPGDVLKAVLAAALLPAAWRLAR
ncbi:biotin transporter BioY [Xylanimonas oleitrophica]|uniref:Biotin transporter n=1 Tax=Xylanimonas oleitrophica TaxID=2607479 RepID=A0A2W5WSH2_9MICO|nr:biotin transporter BioY [Xylanimonas oleitrophica]PZR54307.1 biotin transporter BioY [Xylanimonas oleitrophica]